MVVGGQACSGTCIDLIFGAVVRKVCVQAKRDDGARKHQAKDGRLQADAFVGVSGSRGFFCGHGSSEVGRNLKIFRGQIIDFNRYFLVFSI